jgi:CHAT domain-containing protein/tetratricopeptide (TPR) repeat protein
MWHNFRNTLYCIKTVLLLIILLSFSINSCSQEIDTASIKLQHEAKKMGYYLRMERNFNDALKVELRRKTILTYDTSHCYSCNINTLKNLTTSLLWLNRIQEAEDYCKAAYDSIQIYGITNSDYSTILGHLAFLSQRFGQFRKASEYSYKALALLENTSDFQSLSVVYYNIAIIEKQLGNYQKSLVAFEQSLKVSETYLGKSSNIYRRTLGQLGTLYELMGRHTDALSTFMQVKSLDEGLSDTTYALYSTNIMNIGIVNLRLGKITEAYPYYKLALRNTLANQGELSEKYAEQLKSFSEYYLTLKSYDSAQLLLKSSLVISEKLHGAEHYACGTVKEQLGLVSLLRQEYDSALSYFNDCLNIYRKTLNLIHPLYVSASNYQALSLFKSGDVANGVSLTLANNQNLIKYTQTNFNFLTEIEKPKFLKKIDTKFNFLKTTASLFGKEYPELISTVYDNELLVKGMILQSSIDFQELLSSQGSNTLLKSFRELKRLKTQIAKSESTAKKSIVNIDSLKKVANQLERELVFSSAEFKSRQGQNTISWQDIRNKLNPNDLAIEFIRYGDSLTLDSTTYSYAAVLVSSKSEAPSWIPLCSEADLTKVVGTDDGRKMDYVQNLYDIGSRGASFEPESRPTLYQLIWEPLEPYLLNTKNIHYASAGLLHRLNLNAIPVNEDSVLAEKYNLVETGSTRTLMEKNEFNSNKNITLFGGIVYDKHPNTTLDTALDYKYSFSTERGIKTNTWKYLRDTKQEAIKIGDISEKASYTVTIEQEFSGTEAAFKALAVGNTSPRVIHLATHGYFIPDNVTPANNTSWPEHLVMTNNPLTRSGLLLAEANITWRGGIIKDAKEDGILTADEIAHLNLNGTELVVLSACETGLGEIKGDEGVFGLQRAFKQAGVDHIVMSLWQVPDYQTQELMVLFYQRWLEDGMTVQEAFRNAQLEMKNRYRNPYFWAGFKMLN